MIVLTLLLAIISFILLLIIIGFTLLSRLTKETRELKQIVMKLRLAVFRLAHEAPRAAENQANSLMGLEADICAVQQILKQMREDVQRIKEEVE